MTKKKVTNKILKINKEKYPKIWREKKFCSFFLARLLSIPKNIDNPFLIGIPVIYYFHIIQKY